MLGVAVDLIDTAVGAAISAILLGAGYLLKRLIEKSRRRETAGLYTEVADLMLKLRDAGLSIEEVHDFEANLRTRVRQASGSPDAREKLAIQEPDQYWTQASMNQRAAAALAVSGAQLEQSIVELSGYLEDSEQEHLAASQEAWRLHIEAESKLAAAEYDGGSIQPLIRDVELTALTEERIKRIQAIIQDRRSRM